MRDKRQEKKRRNGTGAGPSLLSLLVLGVLLVVPTIALQRVAIEGWKLATYAVALSVITYGTYARDKNRARTQSWRIPEAHLHLLELLGGWPGAWLAQQRLRHKCAKRSYQFAFWLIILTHQFAAFDSLQGWRLSTMMMNEVKEVSRQLR